MRNIKSKIAKARSCAYFLKLCFSNLGPGSFCNLYKAFVLPRLEFCSPVWNPPSAMLSNAVESVQRFTTRSVRSLRHLPYPNRLRDLGLVTLKFHRLREDLVSLYKVFNGKAGMKEALGIGDRQVRTRVHQFPIFKENRQNKYRNILTACLQLLEQAPFLCGRGVNSE